MLRTHCCYLAIVILLTACSGGAQGPLPQGSQPQSSATTALPNIAGSLHKCDRHKARCRDQLQDSSLSIYVPNSFGNGSVTVYPASASGNVSPSATLAGPNTQLGPSYAVAFDSAGNLYVRTSGTGCQTSCIDVFAPGAVGNVAPIRSISGPNTGLAPVYVYGGGMAFDREGNLYVVNSSNSVLKFAPGANGDIAPIATISGPLTNLSGPEAIAIDAKDKIYVTNDFGTGCNAGLAGSITIFAAGASGDVAPTATIVGKATGIFDPGGIALDATGNIFVSSVYNSLGITKISPTANGNVPPESVLVGSNTLFASVVGVTIGPSGTIYASGYFFPTETSGVLAFAPGSTGNVAPVQQIIGSNTGLGGSGLLALHASP